MVCPSRLFDDDSYDAVTTGDRVQLTVIGEAHGPVTILPNPRGGLRPTGQFSTEVAGRVVESAGGSMGDRIHIVNTGQYDIGVLAGPDERLKPGAWIAMEVIFRLTLQSYLMPFSHDVRTPVHNCRVDEILLGTRTPGVSRDTHFTSDSSLLRSFDWESVNATALTGPPEIDDLTFFLLWCEIESQRPSGPNW